MAGLPLNTFKNVPFVPTTVLQTVYTAPLGITSIVLMSQVANVTSQEVGVTFIHYSFRTGITTHIVKEIGVPPNDARILLGGKLVLEVGDQIKVRATVNGSLQFIASILETANQ
jgi:hypothetical protein